MVYVYHFAYLMMVLLNIGSTFCMAKPVINQNMTVKYSKPEYNKADNDYTIRAFIGTQQIGHIFYGPSKNPHVPKGTWTIKSIRVAQKHQNKKIGYALFSQALENIKRTSASTISINAIPRLESPMPVETLVSIYLKMIEKYNPQLLKATVIRPWPSDENYKQLLIHLKNSR